MAATAILDFSFFLIFNDRYGQEGQTVSLCQVSSKSLISWPRYGDFSIFPRWRPSAILDLWCECWDDPRRAFDGLYHCAIFGWNRCSSFDYMHVFPFREFGFKTPIHVPKMAFWCFWPLNEEPYKQNPKRHIFARVRVVWALCVKIRRRDWPVGEFIKMRYINKQCVVIFHSFAQKPPPMDDVHLICHKCRSRGRNHLWQMFWWSVIIIIIIIINLLGRHSTGAQQRLPNTT